jgi:Nucleotide modification associated domain 3
VIQVGSRQKRSPLSGCRGKVVRALLVRVGADLSSGGGFWNGPVDAQTGRFVYVSIPESRTIHTGYEKPYTDLTPELSKFGAVLPNHLRARHMHVDPDFDYLTYGDQGARAEQLRTKLRTGDMIIFYAGLKDMRGHARLVYGIIGWFVVGDFILARDVPVTDRHINAHSRRILGEGAMDLVVCGRPGVSGRLKRCLSIGEWRDRAYRVRRDLLDSWGGLSVKDGYLQRSARLPQFLDPIRFQIWLDEQKPEMIQSNN